MLVVVAVVVTAAVHGPRVLGGPGGPRPGARRPRAVPDAAASPEQADSPAGRNRRAAAAPEEAKGVVGLAGGARGTRAPEGSPSPSGAAAAEPRRTPRTPPPALTLRAKVPGRGLDVDLDVAPGEVIALLGANGAGKSTAVQVVAGLLAAGDARGARVVIGDDDVTHVPVHRRRVAWLSQRPLLFEHLTVEENVAFGLRARGVPRDRARHEARDALGRVGAAGLASRRATDLSGGQAQRVSIARALATDPRVLLLDEPLASLDVAVAQHVRSALHRAQRDRPCTTVLVTHDLLDVLLLADRVVVLEDGRVVEDGPVDHVLSRPRSRFAARLAGVNLLSGHVAHVAPTEPGAAEAEAETTLAVDGTGVHVRGTAGEHLAVGDGAVAVFEPRTVAVHRATPEGSPRNAYPVVVRSVEPHGPLLRVWGRVVGEGTGDRSARATTAVGHDAPHLAADLTPRAVAELRLAPDERVWFVVKAAEVRVHPR
ncbi:ABC transporter ATP-binding protein [Cellulosimicrobium marinum]|nr:ABC transporter ATP-binding protein [Cellulosimicrobium marinum]